MLWTWKFKYDNCFTHIAFIYIRIIYKANKVMIGYIQDNQVNQNRSENLDLMTTSNDYYMMTGYSNQLLKILNDESVTVGALMIVGVVILYIFALCYVEGKIAKQENETG